MIPTRCNLNTKQMNNSPINPVNIQFWYPDLGSCSGGTGKQISPFSDIQNDNKALVKIVKNSNVCALALDMMI